MLSVAYASNEILQFSQNKRIFCEVDENDPNMPEVKLNTCIISDLKQQYVAIFVCVK